MSPFISKLLTEVKIWLFALFAFPLMVLFYLFFLLLFFPIRSVVWILAKIFRPDLHSLITGFKSLFAVKSQPKASLNILVTMLLKGHVSVEKFRRDVQTRILPVKETRKNGQGRFLYERLTHTWTIFLGYAFWRIDPNFDVRNHVRPFENPGDELVQLDPENFDEASFVKVKARLLEMPWDPRRGPWELLFFHYKDKKESPEDHGKICPEDLEKNCPENQETICPEDQERTLVFIRFNHVLADAYGLIELTRKLCNCDIKLPNFKLGTHNKPQTLWDKLRILAKMPYDSSKAMLIQLESTKLKHSWRRSRKNLILSVSPTFSVGVVKQIKNHFQVYYGTVISSVIYGAICRAAEASGQKIPRNLCAGYVVPRLNHPGGLGIHTSGVVSCFPLKSASPVARLLEIQENLKAMRKSTVPLVIVGLGDSAGIFPVWFRALLMKITFSMGTSLAVSVIPISTEATLYDGQEMLEQTAAGSTWSDCRILVLSSGINNNQKISFAVNPSVFASEEAAENLGMYVQQELQLLLDSMV